MIKTTVENQVIFLNKLETQKFNNKPMRLSGSRMNATHPQKYINGMYMHHYFHTFKYLDEEGGLFEIEVDYENKYITNSLRKC